MNQYHLAIQLDLDQHPTTLTIVTDQPNNLRQALTNAISALKAQHPTTTDNNAQHPTTTDNNDNHRDAPPRCPVHLTAKPSRYGGLYCPTKKDDGTYCDWKHNGKGAK